MRTTSQTINLNNAAFYTPYERPLNLIPNVCALELIQKVIINIAKHYGSGAGVHNWETLSLTGASNKGILKS
jgi:hypothetical protein